MRITKMIYAVLLLAGLALGQNAGQVGIATFNQPVFKNVDGSILPLNSVIVKNIGQGAHWLTYCTDANSVQIYLQASFNSNDPSFLTPDWFTISNIGTASGCNVLEAGGYFPAVRAHLAAMSGGTFLNAWYSDAAGPLHGFGNAPTGSPFSVAATTTHQAFYVQNTTVNPAVTTTVVVAFNSDTGNFNHTMFSHQVYLACTAACRLLISQITNTGTCTAASAHPMVQGTTPNRSVAVSHDCTVNPTTVGALIVVIGANDSKVIDLEGFAAMPTLGGIAITNVSALVGTLDVTLEWYEQ